MSDQVQHDQFEIVPAEDGKWTWRKRVAGEIVDRSYPTDLRSDAIAAARAQNGDEILTVVRSDGTPVRTQIERQPDALRVVLLRPDESEYGELDPPPSTATGPPQVLTFTPATEAGDAGNENG